MQEFEKEIMQYFDVVINYYGSIDIEKVTTYTHMKKAYYEKIKAFEILPEEEREWVKNIEDVITSEMEFIKERGKIARQ